MSAPRMCSRFYCDHRGDRYCCRDCKRYVMCPNPYENDPSRCGLEDKGGRIEWRSVAKVITDTDGRGRPPRNKQEEDIHENHD